MRVENSIRNIIFGIGSQLISTILAFFTRTVFIYVLGKQYLGIEGLLTNVLSLLSLANLGFESAIIFSLYKPLRENREDEIKSYMCLYKKIYTIVGITTFILGTLIIPILPSLINGDINIKENINIIYFMFLINGSISYFYIYKQSILIANQQNYIISKVHTYFLIISNVLQIITLIIFKAYIPVLTIQLIFRIIENITISKFAEKEFPFLKDSSKYIELSSSKKRNLYKNVYSMLLYKISGLIINSTDNLVISYFLGVIYVGIYSNYLMIVDMIKVFVNYLFFPITASVGNLVSSKEEEKKKFMYNQIFFTSFWIYGFCAISLYILLNDFINIWIGKSYLLDKITVLVIVINFYTAGMQCASTMYRDTTGMFSIGKYRPLIAAIINLIISVLLAPSLKIIGVLMGTIISRICVYFWMDPYIIYKHVFNESCLKYFKKYFSYTFLILLIGIITGKISDYLFLNDMYLNFFIKILICASVPNILLWIIFKNNKHYLYIKDIINSFIKNGVSIK